MATPRLKLVMAMMVRITTHLLATGASQLLSNLLRDIFCLLISLTPHTTHTCTLSAIDYCRRIAPHSNKPDRHRHYGLAMGPLPRPGNWSQHPGLPPSERQCVQP